MPDSNKNKLIKFAIQDFPSVKLTAHSKSLSKAVGLVRNNSALQGLALNSSMVGFASKYQSMLEGVSTKHSRLLSQAFGGEAVGVVSRLRSQLGESSKSHAILQGLGVERPWLRDIGLNGFAFDKSLVGAVSKFAFPQIGLALQGLGIDRSPIWENQRKMSASFKKFGALGNLGSAISLKSKFIEEILYDNKDDIQAVISEVQEQLATVDEVYPAEEEGEVTGNEFNIDIVAQAIAQDLHLAATQVSDLLKLLIKFLNAEFSGIFTTKANRHGFYIGLVFFILSQLYSPNQTQPPQYRKTVLPKTYLKAKPNSKSRVDAVVPANKQVEQIDKKGKWGQYSWEDDNGDFQEGWTLKKNFKARRSN